MNFTKEELNAWLQENKPWEYKNKIYDKTEKIIFFDNKYREAGAWKSFDQWEPEDLKEYKEIIKENYKAFSKMADNLGVLKKENRIDTETTPIETLNISLINITADLTNTLYNYARQAFDNVADKTEEIELFPLFKPSKNVNLKKEFALNFGNIARIKEEFPHLLPVKIIRTGQTFEQHLDNIEKWYQNLKGEDLGNWIKIFGFAQAIKNHVNENEDIHILQEQGPGRFLVHAKTDKYFFQFFIKPDKSTGRYTTKAKKRFLQWLYKNKDAVSFPMITPAGIVTEALKIYDYREIITYTGQTDLILLIDTNILDSVFKDYVSINIEEIDLIEEIWESLAGQEDNFKKYSLNGFIDIPLKFLLTLKQIYSEKGNFTTKDGYEGNVQRLTKENLNTHLGNLKERIESHLKSRGKAGQKKSSIIPKTVKLILDTTWTIATERPWLTSKPTIENGTYTFNINPGYFARKQTALRLKASR